MMKNICYGCMSQNTMSQEAGNLCTACGYQHKETEQASFNLIPGTTLNNGAYLVGEPLGQGGFGITYIGWDLKLDIKLAIKEYYPQAAGGRSSNGVTVAPYSGAKGEDFNYGLTKFLDEAKTVARFQGHPCVVSVLSFFEENGTGYMVMPYIEGVTLLEYLKQQPKSRLSYQKTLSILMPVMDALREVHSKEVLHRDISPDNIYLTHTGQVKLLDFGAARFAMGEHSQSITSMIKPGYSPEEQYRSRGKFGAFTDIYALAATFYRCLTGEPPFTATDRAMGEHISWPSEQGIELPETAEIALKKAMEIKGEARYQTVEGFQQDLVNNNVEEPLEYNSIRQSNFSKLQSQVKSVPKTFKSNKIYEHLKAIRTVNWQPLGTTFMLYGWLLFLIYLMLPFASGKFNITSIAWMYKIFIGFIDGGINTIYTRDELRRFVSLVYHASTLLLPLFLYNSSLKKIKFIFIFFSVLTVIEGIHFTYGMRFLLGGLTSLYVYILSCLMMVIGSILHYRYISQCDHGLNIQGQTSFRNKWIIIPVISTAIIIILLSIRLAFEK